MTYRTMLVLVALGFVGCDEDTKDTDQRGGDAADDWRDRVVCGAMGDMNGDGAIGDGQSCEAIACVDAQTGKGYYEARGEELLCDGMCSIGDNCTLYRFCGWDAQTLSDVGC